MIAEEQFVTPPSNPAGSCNSLLQGQFGPEILTREGIVGITQFTRKEHIARATIEATCYQTKAILDAMEKDSGTTLHALAVDGGMSNSDVCMQVSPICSPSLDLPPMLCTRDYLTQCGG